MHIRNNDESEKNKSTQIYCSTSPRSIVQGCSTVTGLHGSVVNAHTGQVCGYV